MYCYDNVIVAVNRCCTSCRLAGMYRFCSIPECASHSRSSSLLHSTSVLCWYSASRLNATSPSVTRSSVRDSARPAEQRSLSLPLSVLLLRCTPSRATSGSSSRRLLKRRTRLQAEYTSLVDLIVLNFCKYSATTVTLYRELERTGNFKYSLRRRLLLKVLGNDYFITEFFGKKT